MFAFFEKPEYLKNFATLDFKGCEHNNEKYEHLI